MAKEPIILFEKPYFVEGVKLNKICNLVMITIFVKDPTSKKKTKLVIEKTEEEIMCMKDFIKSMGLEPLRKKILRALRDLIRDNSPLGIDIKNTITHAKRQESYIKILNKMKQLFLEGTSKSCVGAISTK